MWDKRYSTDDYIYGTAPNDFLAARVADLRPGAVLCLAEGEGRNSVFLAEQGFAPMAVDSSGVGLHKARKLAGERSVTIETVCADLADFVIEPGAWDSIVSVFCHLPPELRRSVHADVVRGLKPGGTFLLEAFTPRQLEFKTGGPSSVELLMTLEMLENELAGLEIVHGRERVREVLEGPHHTGRAAVVQVLAHKP